MNLKKEMYEVEFTEDCRDEIKDIYKYISNNLDAYIAARKLMRKIKERIINLAESPQIYIKISKTDKRKREFRRMVIDNYVILYTIDEDNKVVYISHMYYARRNYLEDLF